MIHTIRIFRTAIFMTVSIAALSVVSALIYLNQVGFPGEHGEWIRKELSKKGLHLSFESLRFEINRGLVATKVSLYQDEDRSIALLEADEMTLDLDKTKALRGKFKLLGLQLTNGSAKIPVKDESRFLNARQINGDLEITDNDRAILRNASALVEGIQIEFSANLKLLGSQEPSTEQEGTNRTDQIISGFLDELSLWNYPADTPPKLSFQVEGDLNQPQLIHTEFQFSATNIGRTNYQLHEIILSGDLSAQIITLDDILLQDRTGTISGQADWCLHRRDGRFDLISNFHPQEFARDSLDHSLLPELKLTTPPTLKLRGRYALPEDAPLSVKATGEIELKSFQFQETSYDDLSSEFSWHDGNLFLRNIELTHKEKNLKGNVLIKGDEVRFDLDSKLSLAAFQPVIKPGSELERALSDLTFSPDSLVNAKLVGSLNWRDPKIWSTNGFARLDNFIYKGTKIHHLETNFELNRDQAAFSDIKALLNDTNERARLRYRGKASGEIFADNILFDSNSSSPFVTITNLRGKVWPTPIVRIFDPETADHLEQNYRFYELPQLTLNGRFAGLSKDYQKSTFSVAVRTTGQTDYPFLGSNLPLQNLKADVIVQGHNISVKTLSASTLDGSLSGSIFCDVDPSQKTKYRGAIKWDKVSFRQLSRIYEFDEEEKGTLTGKIDFRGSDGSVRNFNAEGIVAINGGNLVSLPILGPLSPIIAGVLGDKRMGYERAKDASAPFAVRKGILQTKDFVAVSTNVTLTGEGWVDLLTEKMDMVIRVNARGLLGFLTLPLQPLRGIFQFRGSGTYDDPKWRSAPFTRPSKGNKDPIFQTPSRATIVPE